MPPAVSVGVAIVGGNHRGVLLSAGVLVGDTLLLGVVGTLAAAVTTAPAYPLAGSVGVVAVVVAVALAAR